MNLPVFIAPLQEKKESSIEKIELSNGNFAVRVKNNGNAHIMVNKLIVTGLDGIGNAVFSQEISGWYTLASMARTYTVQLSQEDCQKAESIKVVAEMGKLSMSSVLKGFDIIQCRRNEPKGISGGEDKQ